MAHLGRNELALFRHNTLGAMQIKGVMERSAIAPFHEAVLIHRRGRRGNEKSFFSALSATSAVNHLLIFIDDVEFAGHRVDATLFHRICKFTGSANFMIGRECQ